MSVIIPVRYENKPCYNIIIENGFDKLNDEIKDFDTVSRKACIVTESNVGPLYAEEVKSILSNVFDKVLIFQFEAGEASKNLDTVSKLYEYLIINKFDRKDMLFALGGGVVGDLTGFTASTYLRGIKFIQLPTSLLSQVDSSIGGKTGVDFNGYKNMVGAFYQPSLVYMNLNTLKSLPVREYLSGMGEIVKHGFIKDIGYLNWLNDNFEAVKSLDFEALKYMISESCMIKRAVVEYDPKEVLGERALLNFGHTLGHAIEKKCNFKLLHGECVALGMVAALNISYIKGYINDRELKFGKDILKKYSLPIKISEIYDENIDAENVVLASKSDKKMDSNRIKFIVLDNLGKAKIDDEITDKEMLESLADVLV